MISVHKGQILAEVVVAIGIIMLVLIGMSSLMSKTTKAIRQNTTKDEAAALVESQIRYYKDQRDRDVNGFFANLPLQRDTPLDCNASGAWSVPTPTPVIIPIKCAVTYSDNVGTVGSGIGITVTASWTEESTGDRSVSLSSSLMKF